MSRDYQRAAHRKRRHERSRRRRASERDKGQGLYASSWAGRPAGGPPPPEPDRLLADFDFGSHELRSRFGSVLLEEAAAGSAPLGGEFGPLSLVVEGSSEGGVAPQGVWTGAGGWTLAADLTDGLTILAFARRNTTEGQAATSAGLVHLRTASASSPEDAVYCNMVGGSSTESGASVGKVDAGAFGFDNQTGGALREWHVWGAHLSTTGVLASVDGSAGSVVSDTKTPQNLDRLSIGSAELIYSTTPASQPAGLKRIDLGRVLVYSGDGVPDVAALLAYYQGVTD